MDFPGGGKFNNRVIVFAVQYGADDVLIPNSIAVTFATGRSAAYAFLDPEDWSS